MTLDAPSQNGPDQVTSVVAEYATPRLARRRRRFGLAIAAVVVAAGGAAAWLTWGGDDPITPVAPPVAAAPEVVAVPSAVAEIEPPRLEDATVRAAAGWADVEVVNPAHGEVTRLVTAPRHGTVSFADGVISYRAEPTFAGLDTVTYEACRAQSDACATATVTFQTVPDLASRFVSDPAPLVDTRPDAGGEGPLTPGTTIELGVAPRDATAGIFSVAVMAPQQSGDLAFSDTDAAVAARLPVAAAQAMTTGLLYVPVVGGSALQLDVGSGGMVVVDQVGWYLAADAAAEGRFVSVATKRIARLVTKSDGRQATVDVAAHPSIPQDQAGAVLVRVTADVGRKGGRVALGSGGDVSFRLMWPSSDGSATRVRQGVAIVPLSPAGTFEFEYNGGSDITIDALGYFTNEAAPAAVTGLFVPVRAAGASSIELESQATAAVELPATIPGYAAAAVVEIDGAATEEAADVAVFAADDGVPQSPTVRLDPGVGQSVTSVVEIAPGGNSVLVFSSEAAAVSVRVTGYYLR